LQKKEAGEAKPRLSCFGCLLLLRQPGDGDQGIVMAPVLATVPVLAPAGSAP